MSGFCGMDTDGFLTCPRCGDQWHGIPCSEASDVTCDCPSSCANSSQPMQESLDRD